MAPRRHNGDRLAEEPVGVVLEDAQPPARNGSGLSR
jgi:hypothetical protein